ncbi:Peptidase M20 domain-containing protein 2, partial [Stegodyphus mimosarum]
MSEQDFAIVCSKIDEEKEFLNSVSQDIWKMPELLFKEFHAHAILTSALERYGFKVQKHYFMPTAFRAEYSSASDGGPTVAILLEYDALPEIGHACGHNLIAEAGLAASVAVKAAMEADLRLAGKLIVLGTPAEEGGGGKIRLIELGAFKGVDIALMAHPARMNAAAPPFLSIVRGTVEYKGKEAHASASPWKGRNALDAAVACYQNIALLRQHIKPSCKIHSVITKGGIIPNIIPAESCLKMFIRAPNKVELRELRTRVEACITSAATATGCEVTYSFADQDSYENLITNKVLGNLYQTYAERLGADFIKDVSEIPSSGSTDMGNVSHIIPSIHPLFSICPEATNHTREFTKASGAPEAQEPTLITAKAMAMTALTILRSQETLDEVKKEFSSDIQNSLQYQ